jgi:large subunit ribosomal protein L23
MNIFSALKHKDNKEKTDKKDQKVLDSEKNKDSKKELTVGEIADKGSAKGKSRSKGSKSKSNKHDTKDAYKVLVKALITEKASYLKSENKYLFEVNPNTNKNEIKKAIYHVYGVWPSKINVSNLGGKNKRYGKNSGVTKARKKAIVTLKKGDSMELYEGV